MSVTYAVDAGVATITLAAPEARNVLTASTRCARSSSTCRAAAYDDDRAASSS